jgi:sugar phosphate isomerase/epimerase
MIRVGLSSQALLTKSPSEVLALAKAAGLDGVEWAGEAHVPTGDGAAQDRVLMETLRAGLTVASLSSLYRATPGAEQGLGFESLLAGAVRLQAPVLRVYAGALPSERLAPAEREGLQGELRRLGDLAGARGVTVCLSLGRNTSLDGYAAAAAMVGGAAHPFVRLAWEPLPGVEAAKATAALESAARGVGLLLAKRSDREGRGGPLSEEGEAWRRRLEAYRSGEGDPSMSRFVLLGRLGEDDEGRLREDAAFIRSLA